MKTIKLNAKNREKIKSGKLCTGNLEILRKLRGELKEKEDPNVLLTAFWISIIVALLLAVAIYPWR